jgi:hypothetical protein
VKIAKNLNLVIPIDLGDGVAYIHSTPISRLVYEQFYAVISKTFTRIFTEGFGTITGSRVAYLILKDVSNETNEWQKVENGLINEIYRLSNVVMLKENGWVTLPLQTIINQKSLDENDIADIIGELVFFTCVSWVQKRSGIQETLTAINGLWGSLITSLDCMEYKNSLTILTEKENTGEMEKTSSPIY